MYQQIDNSNMTGRNDASITLHPTLENGQTVLRLQMSEPGGGKFELSEDEKEKLNSQAYLAEAGFRSCILQANSDQETTHILKESNTPPENNSNQEEYSKISSQIKLQTSHSIGPLSAEWKSREIMRPALYKLARPPLLSKKSEELRQANSMELELSKSEPKEPMSAGHKSNKEDNNGASFLSDIVITRKRGTDDQKKGTFIKRGSLLSKPVTISLPFDYFVDQVKGREPNSIASNYPSYKIDKRLIFLGKEVDIPWHLISYHSTFRKVWNLFIVAMITYEIFWYPLAVAFLSPESWPLGSFIFEFISLFIFLVDIVINIRTTYSNENNEEIIDSRMISKNYLKSKLFIIDLITTLPIPEILILILINSSIQWSVYSWIILIRMSRILKIPKYFQNRTFRVFTKLLKIFITFFLVVHWVSCIWYLIIKAEYSDPTDPSTLDSLWFPNNLRMIATGDDDLLAYYSSMETVKVYGYTLLSVFMIVVGSDMAPVTNVQIWLSVLIGLFGAVGLAYNFALVTLTINRAYQESSLYQQQLEELKRKLRINKVPHNLRVKVMEYFYYSWRKHSVLKKMDDFSELSIPLQRDLALYQHQEMLLKVPLFKELDPVEILSIVQKLKTAIYMPGDKIIREGEKGTEMFFIQEGVVEMLIKKATLKGTNQTGNSKFRYEKLLLEKGSYFGEVALMSNSKRTFDVNAFEFCILYSFSRTDYHSLKNEFKDIGPRLRSGLKHYKNTHMQSLIQILKSLDIFKNFTEKELRRIGDEYLEEVFVDPDKVILRPKNRTNGIYIMLGGNVNCYEDNEETRNYLNHLKRSDNKDNWTIVDIDEEEEIDCLDDDILNLEKDKLSMEDQKKKLDLYKVYTYGEYFGTLDFDTNEIKCTRYYVSDTGCQIGVITQSLKSQMANEDPHLFRKLEENVRRLTPKRAAMGAIEEESDSSFTTKNNTLIKTKLSRKVPSFTDLGKKPFLIKVPSHIQNKEEDLATIKDDFQQLEEEMNNFKTLISGINGKLNRIAAGFSPGLRSGEGSPDKHKPTFKTLSQIINQARLDKVAPNKELATSLVGVDEEDQAEESKSIRRDE